MKRDRVIPTTILPPTQMVIALLFMFGIGFASTMYKGKSTDNRARATLIVGKTYYIDKHNVGGTGCNDSWPGTKEQPFCTFTPASVVLQPGDGVYFRAGEYPTFTFTKSGQQDKYITIAANPEEKVTIKGADDGILLKGASYIAISGFDVTGATGNWLGGIRLTRNNSVYPSHNIIEQNTVHDNTGTNTYGIVAEYSSYTIVRKNTVYNSYQSGINLVQNDTIDPGFDLVGNEVRENTVYGNVLGGGNADGIKIEGWRYKNNTIANNIVYGNGDDGIDTWNSSGNMIVGNISYNHKGPGDGNGFKLGGINKVTNLPTGGSNTVKQNIAFGNKYNGFDSNGSGGNKYYNNVAYGNGSMGFEDGWKHANCTTSICTPTTYINNIGYNNTRANFSASKYTGVSHNNLWFSDGAGAKVFYEYAPYSTLAAFYKASGNRLDNPLADTASSLEISPQFVSTVLGGFALQSTSPAINAGYPENPGSIQAQDRVDIGAKEFGSATGTGSGTTPSPTSSALMTISATPTTTPIPLATKTATPTPTKAPTPTYTPTPTPAGGPTITTTSLPRGDRGQSYSTVVTATDPTLSDVIGMTVKGMPTGLTLGNCTSTSGFGGTTSTCSISGTPTTKGNYSPIFTVIDLAGHMSSKTLKVQVR